MPGRRSSIERDPSSPSAEGDGVAVGSTAAHARCEQATASDAEVDEVGVGQGRLVR